MWQSLVVCLAYFISRQHHVASVGFKRSVVDSGVGDVSIFRLRSFCDYFKDLNSRQRDICQNQMELMGSVADGANLAKKECVKQFKNERWNCSIAGKSTMLGRMTKLANREAAFHYALVCAGIIHVMARDCMKGVLKSCHCSQAKRPEMLAKINKWGGCGDNIEFAMEFSRRFLDDPMAKNLEDNPNVKVSAKVLMDMHNNEAGRQAILKNREIVCKCHGVTGNCQIRTCWYQVKNFYDIGDYLKKKYTTALKVRLGKRRKGKKLLLKVKANDKPTYQKKDELVYVEDSPSYCRKKERHHSLGTVGRQCNATATNEGSCDKLCCGRGYKTERKNVIKKCECNFVWCCDVKCKTCSQVVNINTCI